MQNLPQNHIEDLGLARRFVREGRFEDVEMFYDSTPNVLSELIRTAFVPEPGCRFVVADFSAIEARVLACLPGSGGGWRCFLPMGRFMRLLRLLCSMFRLRK